MNFYEFLDRNGFGLWIIFVLLIISPMFLYGFIKYQTQQTERLKEIRVILQTGQISQLTKEKLELQLIELTK